MKVEELMASILAPSSPLSALPATARSPGACDGFINVIFFYKEMASRFGVEFQQMG